MHAIELQVKEAATELGYQSDETFCLKISQLRELFVVRWSVFLLGPSGCGKTAIWRTLMKAQNNAGEKTVRGVVICPCLADVATSIAFASVEQCHTQKCFFVCGDLLGFDVSHYVTDRLACVEYIMH